MPQRYTPALTALFGVFNSYLASSEIVCGDVQDRADLLIKMVAVAAALLIALWSGGSRLFKPLRAD